MPEPAALGAFCAALVTAWSLIAAWSYTHGRHL